MNDDLPEERFINESKDPQPLWVWFFVCVAVGLVFWGSYSWWQSERRVELQGKPFLQVTNRQMSLFLWQFPQFMRANYVKKFQEGTVAPTLAESFVEADPSVLFFYHTWSRLLREEFSARPIPTDLFKEFLVSTAIWKPEYWPASPPAYKQFVAKLPGDTLEKASLNELPLEVRMAFQGWRNFFKEGDAIDAVQPTYREMATFLAANPNYARNFWRNPLNETRPDYLLKEGEASEKIPADQLDGFLKVAYYNYLMATQGK